MTKKKRYAAAAIAAAGAVVLLAVLLWRRHAPVPYLIYEGDSSKVREMEKDRQDTFFIGVTQIPASIHPYEGENETMEILKKLVYEPLAYRNRDGSMAYALAEKITIEPDGKAAVAVLKQGLTFSDGQEVTAEDVAAAYRWHQNAAVGSAYQPVLQGVASMEAEGTDTLRLEFIENSIENLEVFTVPVMHVSEKILEKNETLAGCGPYELSALIPSKAVKLALREETSTREYPYQKIQIEALAGTDFTEVLKEQPYDWLYISDIQLDAVCKDGAYDVYEFGKEYGKYLVLNKNHQEMADLNGRRQAASAIDREKLFEDCFDQGLLPQGFLTDGSKKQKMKAEGADGKLENLTLYRELDGSSIAVADWVTEALKAQGITATQRDKTGEAPLFGEDVAMYLYNGWYEDLLEETTQFTAETEMELLEYCTAWEDWLWEDSWILPLWQEGRYGAALAGREITELIR